MTFNHDPGPVPSSRSKRHAVMLIGTFLALPALGTPALGEEYIDLLRCRTQPPVLRIGVDEANEWQQTEIEIVNEYFLTRLIYGAGRDEYLGRAPGETRIGSDACEDPVDGVVHCHMFTFDTIGLRFTRIEQRYSSEEGNATFVEMGFCEPIPQDDAPSDAPNVSPP